MADEYIKREAAIEETRKPRLTDAELRRRLALIPAADVYPVVHARWIEDGDNQPMSCDKCYCCSNCHGNRRFEWHLKPFCEDCGTKMEAQDG